MRFLPSYGFLAFAGACLGIGWSAVRADDPMPFPATPDTAAIADGATLPKLIKRVEPVLPAGSASLAYEQQVYVAFIVDGQGKVCHASALFGPQPVYAQAAVEAVKQWEFAPGLHYFSEMKRLLPVGTQMTVLLHFMPTRTAAGK